MEKQAYLNELSSLLEVKVDMLADDFSLGSNQLWDSLSIVSTIASIDHHYHVAVQGDALERCNNIGDIFKLIEQKSADQNNAAFAGT